MFRVCEWCCLPVRVMCVLGLEWCCLPVRVMCVWVLHVDVDVMLSSS